MRAWVARAARRAARIAARLLLRLLAAPSLQRAVAVALFAIGIGAASGWVRAEVNRDARYRIDGARIAALPAPPGMGPRAVQDLATLPMARGTFQARDDEALPSIAHAYRSLGWVRSVDRVAIDFPNRLVFEISVRRPAVGLSAGERTWLLDEEGTVLPADRYAPRDPRALELPVLVGAVGREPWTDPAVRHGLGVAAALRTPSLAGRFASPVTIEVSNVDGRQDPRRSEIVVRSGPLTIEWGRSPVTERLHIPTGEKVSRLASLLRHAPQAPTLIQLQYDDLVVRAQTTSALAD